jgi:hypothetical protein
MFLDKSLMQRIYDTPGLVFTKMKNTYIPAHTIFISLVIKSLSISVWFAWSMWENDLTIFKKEKYKNRNSPYWNKPKKQ